MLADERTLRQPIFEKLGVAEVGYRLGSFWTEGQTEVDIILEHPADRESRIIECKWIADSSRASLAWLDQLDQKAYKAPRGYQKRAFLAVSQPISGAVMRAAVERQIGVIGLQDLF